jgi:DNA-binding PadR family transcriptional regulator
LYFFSICRSIEGMARRDRLGEFEGIVLLAVARLDGEGYGVTVRHEIEARTGRSPALGAVYATLERLEAKGWVRSRAGEATPMRGGRARRHFALTAEGIRALRVARAALERLWEGLELGPARRVAR